MNIASIIDKTAPITFEYTGKDKATTSITVDVREDSMTPEVLKSMAKLQEKNDVDGLVDGLAMIVTGWDINYNNETFLPSAANLSKLPFSFLTALLEAIAGTWQETRRRRANK